ncbi:transketolase [Rhizocola hellebori]|uniref:Transketolase n=1 Tax=Rhizocola hellebori TaxID=1392758 RepID=A0A8J3VK51_9ACTN|nr:transketolase C-terminal domain-containing protein [Rhizocola hellebori]GIH09385.1 transketolase [Rhizocola hellebori]
MRNAAINELAELARADSRIMLLTADLGFGVLDNFARELPKQFVNVGVAEQAMVGVATGMAEAGLLPYCYSIATFSFLRPFEFIRNGPVAHRLPVTIMGVGAGTDYSFDGMTHYAIEDLAMARSQPGLTIYAPVTDDDARVLVREAGERPGPAYIRLNRQGSPRPSQDIRAEQPQQTDVLVLALGNGQERAHAIAERVHDSGVQTRVLSVLRFDEQTADDLAAHLAQAKVCLTVEDHYQVGGLGSAAADVIATRGIGVRLVKDAIAALPVGRIGSPQFVINKLHRPVDDLAADLVSRLPSVR